MEQNKEVKGRTFSYRRDLTPVPARGQIVVPRGHGDIHKLFSNTEIRGAAGENQVHLEPVKSQVVKPVQMVQPQRLAKTVQQPRPVLRSVTQAQVGQVKPSQPKFSQPAQLKRPVRFEDFTTATKPVIKQTAVHSAPTSPIVAAQPRSVSSAPAAKTPAIIQAQLAESLPRTEQIKTAAPFATTSPSITTTNAKKSRAEKRAEKARIKAQAKVWAKANKAKRHETELWKEEQKSQEKQETQLSVQKPVQAKAAKTEQPQAKPVQAKTQFQQALQTAAQTSAQPKAQPLAQPKLQQHIQSRVQSQLQAQPTSAERVLASASTISEQAARPQQTSVDASGAAAITQQNVLDAPRIAFTFKVNKARLFAVMRVIIITVILAVSGYLAWDTWMTNKSVENTFSNPAAAMSIDSTNPSTADPTSISNQQWSAYTTPADQPRYMYIPSLNVRARVMSVGVTSKGNIDTPKNLNDTAWYDGSAKPGLDGEVFIDGHTSFSDNVAAAFNDLPKIQKDAVITVELGNGNKVNYQVTSTETMAANAVDMNKILSTPDGVSKGLTLMTCTGSFNYRTQESTQRFVVYATQV